MHQHTRPAGRSWCSAPHPFPSKFECPYASYNFSSDSFDGIITAHAPCLGLLVVNTGVKQFSLPKRGCGFPLQPSTTPGKYLSFSFILSFPSLPPSLPRNLQMVLAIRNPPVTPDKKAAAVRAIVVEQEGANSNQEGMVGRATPAGSSEADATEQHLLSIHRCRFLNWEPQAVVCMAVSASGQLLAVARESGSVEIRLVLEKFRVVGMVPLPGKTGLIRALAWSQDVQDTRARLFVGTLDTFISEIDVTGMRVKHRRDSYGGAVWCLAVAPAQDLLAVGCEDGSVKLFSTADDALEFSRALPTVNARVLSLAWQMFPASSVPISSSASSSRQQLGIFVGAIDGTIRHLDAITGHSAYRMTVEARNSVHPAMIWCLKSLRDGTLVSGDSLGNIHFWDGALGTLKQSFSVHEADILALEAGPMGETVFASGVDSKLVCLKRQPSSQQQQKQQHQHQRVEASNGTWVATASNRAHSHDVRALALVRKSSGRQEGGGGRQSYLLVSGGEDTKLCTYSVNAFARMRPRYIAPYPYHPLASLASRHPARLLLMQHDRKLHLWALGATKDETAAVLRHEPSPVLEIQAAKGELIICSTLSPNGRFLAYATGEELRVFEVEMEKEEEDESGREERGRVNLQRWKPSALQRAGVRKGITALAFCPDSKTLVLGTGGGRVLRLRLDLPVAVVEEARDDSTSAGAEGRCVVRLSCSQDGRSVAVGRWNGEVEIYSILSGERKKKKKKEGGEAAAAVAGEGERELTLSWRLPRLDSAPTALAYQPEADVLVIACVSNRFYLFDIEAQQLTGWSKDFGHRLPKELLDRHDCVLGICFNPDSSNALILHGFGFVCYVDLDRPMGRHVQLLPRTHPAALAQREGIRKRNPPWVVAMKQKKQKKKKEEKKNEEAEGTMLPAAEAAATAGGRVETMPNGGGRRRTRGESIAEEEEMREQLMAAAAAATETAKLARRPANVEEKEDAWNFMLHLGYQGVLAVLALGRDELLVVEEPWIKIVSKLPDVLHRQRYGT